GESSASRDLLEGNDEVCVPGLMPCDLRSVHRGVKRLSKQIHDRYKTEKRMAKILRQKELHRNGQTFDIIALDSAVRANRSESLKMMRLITDLSREFSERKSQNRKAEELNRWEAWVKGRIPNSLQFQEEPSIHIAPIPRADDPTMPPKRRSQTNPQLTLTQDDANQLVQDGIAAAIRDERERFHGTKGAVGLVCWFENMENTFEISECAEFGNFHVGESAALRDLLEGNSEVCIPGLMPCDLRSVHMGVKRLSKQMHDRYKTEKRMAKIPRQEELRRNGQAFDITALDSAVRANRSESSKMMRTMPPKRRSQTNPQLTLTQEDVDQLVQDGIAAAIRDERERLKDMNIAAYTERFNELALLCPDAVPNEKKKVELYIKGLPEIIKGETTSSRPVTLNEAVRMVHALMEQKIQSKNERIAEGLKRKWENNNQGNNNNNNNHN
nr:reverse transcriptase domain-containing protein [Tanacetum cinerariifolium]